LHFVVVVALSSYGLDSKIFLEGSSYKLVLSFVVVALMLEEE